MLAIGWQALAFVAAIWQFFARWWSTGAGIWGPLDGFCQIWANFVYILQLDPYP
jgi:hypothetical protein